MSGDPVRAARADARRIVRAGLREVAPAAVAAVEREDRDRMRAQFRAITDAYRRLGVVCATAADNIARAFR